MPRQNTDLRRRKRALVKSEGALKYLFIHEFLTAAECQTCQERIEDAQKQWEHDWDNLHKGGYKE